MARIGASPHSELASFKPWRFIFVVSSFWTVNALTFLLPWAQCVEQHVSGMPIRTISQRGFSERRNRLP